MNIRERVLDALERLILEGSAAPSLDAVAAGAGVSKGGLLHHFPDRGALTHGLILRAVGEVDAAMQAAAGRGAAAETWLRLSVPDAEHQSAARAMLVSVRLTGTGQLDLPPAVREATARWHAMITEELGDARAADVVRLVGDGLFLQALIGPSPDPQRVDDLVDHLVRRPQAGPA